MKANRSDDGSSVDSGLLYTTRQKVRSNFTMKADNSRLLENSQQFGLFILKHLHLFIISQSLLMINALFEILIVNSKHISLDFLDFAN